MPTTQRPIAKHGWCRVARRATARPAGTTPLAVITCRGSWSASGTGLGPGDQGTGPSTLTADGSAAVSPVPGGHPGGQPRDHRGSLGHDQDHAEFAIGCTEHDVFR